MGVKKSAYSIEDLLGDDSSFTNMSPTEREYFAQLLSEEIKRRDLESTPIQLREVVPIEEWIESEYYVGPDVRNLYPYWKDFAIEVFRGDRTPDEKITQIILGGCFTGDTKVSLLDGREMSFTDLVNEFGTDKSFWVYSMDKNGNIVPGKASNVRKTKFNQKLICITLDNGEKIKCTLDHKFLKRDNTYCRADKLKEGDSLMPLYREYVRQGKGDSGCPDEYERVYVPSSGTYKTTHSIVCKSLKQEHIDKVKKEYGNSCIVVIHHYDFNKHNNTPDNLIPMDSYEHFRLHNRLLQQALKDPIKGKKIKDKMSRACKNRWKYDKQYRDKMSRIAKERANSNEYLENHWRLVREKGIEYSRSEEGIRRSIENLMRWNMRIDVSEEDIQRWKDSIGRSSKKWWNSVEGEKEKRVRSKRLSDWNNQGNASRIAKDFWNSEKGSKEKERRAQVYRDRNKKRTEKILKEKREFYESKGININVLKDVVKKCSTWGMVERALNSKYDICLDGSSHMNTLLHCFGIYDRKEFTDSLEAYGYLYKNHKVVKVEILNEYEDVYDLEVEKYHNFALSAGVFVHNSIGIGKSTIAEILMLRKMYELSCWKNINSLFHLMSKTSIMFIYFSVNKQQAERTGFGDMRNLVDRSPYFKEHFKRKGRIKDILLFPEGITFAYGSGSSDSIGMSVIGTIMDEANFSGGYRASGNTERASEMYAGIVNRANSRFIMDGGINHSLNILVSSSTTENSVTERQIAASKGDKHTIVCTPSQWEVKPDKFSKKFFYVCKGTDYLEPHIVRSTDDINNFRVSEGMSKDKYVDGIEDFDKIDEEIKKLPNHMQSKFLKVPIDLKNGFEMNIMRSLQDIGGVSVASSGRLFTSVAVYNDCIDKRFFHPFISESIIISTGDNIEVKDFLRSDFRLKHPERPRFLHIDQSYRTDDTGIASVYVHDVLEDNGVKKPVFGVDFILQVNPPKPPRKIAIYKIRNFVVYLANVVGMKMGMISYDIFNSEESRQILEEMGFNVRYQSVDRTDKAYLDLVEIMFEGRLKMYDYKVFRNEIFNVIHDRDRRKVDHLKTNPDGCFVGNTMIQCVDGIYSMEQLSRVSKPVYVYGYINGRVTISKVNRVWRTKYTSTLIHIILSNGKSICCTPDHRFLLSNERYVSALELDYYDELMGYTNAHIIHTVLMCLDKAVPVYDMEVPETHNFLLEAGIFVHNSTGKKDTSDALAGAIENALQFKISDEEGNQGTLEDFLRVNEINTLYEPDAMSVEEMVDKQIEDMIEDMEYSYDIGGFGYF